MKGEKIKYVCIHIGLLQRYNTAEVPRTIAKGAYFFTKTIQLASGICPQTPFTRDLLFSCPPPNKAQPVQHVHIHITTYNSYSQQLLYCITCVCTLLQQYFSHNISFHYGNVGTVIIRTKIKQCCLYGVSYMYLYALLGYIIVFLLYRMIITIDHYNTIYILQ